MFVLVNREIIGRVAVALVKRIEEGAPLNAGAVEIGSAPALPVGSNNSCGAVIVLQ